MKNRHFFSIVMALTFTVFFGACNKDNQVIDMDATIVTYGNAGSKVYVDGGENGTHFAYWYDGNDEDYYDKVMIYALDRVHWMGLTEKGFRYPKDFVPEAFFEDCFGIIADKNVKPETVKFKVSAGQANYLRTLTLHQTQREIEHTDEYSIFTVRLRPTFDFRQEILSQGSDIEVLSPKWFRDEVAEISKRMWNKYKLD